MSNNEDNAAAWDEFLHTQNPFATTVDAWDNHLFEVNPFGVRNLPVCFIISIVVVAISFLYAFTSCYSY